MILQEEGRVSTKEWNPNQFSLVKIVFWSFTEKGDGQSRWILNIKRPLKYKEYICVCMRVAVGGKSFFEVIS